MGKDWFERAADEIIDLFKYKHKLTPAVAEIIERHAREALQREADKIGLTENVTAVFTVKDVKGLNVKCR